MISVDVKVNIKQQEIKDLVVLSSKPKIQCKKGVHFSFGFGWYSIHLDIVH